MKRSHIPLFLALLLAQSTHLSAADPGWWAARGVTTAASPSNNSPATIGQAKWMVSQALAELQDKLSGPDFLALKASVQAVMPLTTPQTPEAAEKLRGVLRVGQLKAIAQPFYDRLRSTDAAWLDAQMTAAGTRIAIAGSNPVRFHPYPWTTVTTAANSSPANLGQLKAVFALTFPDWTPTNADTDQDGLSDNWEWLYFGGLSQTGLSDTDGDAYTNAQEFAMASNPSLVEKDSNSNGLPDAWEAANVGKFSAFPPFTVASLTRGRTFPAPIILKNDTAATVNYTVSNTGNTGPAYTYEVGRINGSTGLGWENISTSGTKLTDISDADDASQVVSFSGFTFPFYGKNYSEVYVSSNGILTFNTGYSSGANQTIPGESAPPALIAPYWVNLNPASSGDIYFKQSGGQLIIQFENVLNTANFDPVTFQVILYSSGEIRFKYLKVDRYAYYLTVSGIQDSAKVLGLRIPPGELFNENGNTVLIKPRSEFRTLSVPNLQSITPGSTVTIAGSLRSLTLPGAVYQNETQISQVGSSLPPQTLTARLTVVDPPTAVALTAPAAGGTMVSGNFLDLTAQATDADGVAKILFYDGDTLLGDDREPPYTCRAATLSNGTRAFTAIAIDKYGTRTTSSPIPYTVLADSDGDGMPDTWELANGFDPQIKDSDQDPDHDLYTNLEEYLNGTNPRADGLNIDADNDGMSDRWEVRNGLNTAINDSALDPDADGLSNLGEYQAHTGPFYPDTDGDYLPDGWEIQNNLVAANSIQINGYSVDGASGANGKDGDPDGDGIENQYEYVLGFDPKNVNSNVNFTVTPDTTRDRDGDGMPDSWEAATGTWTWGSALQRNVFTKKLDWTVSDSAQDFDGDGLSNLREYQIATNPIDPDTDGDLLPDGWEKDHGLNPKSSYSNDGGDGDPDGDGILNKYEFLLGFDPKNANTNGTQDTTKDRDGDGIPDRVEAKAGYWNFDLDPYQFIKRLDWTLADSSKDFDADGLSCLTEYQLGLDMFNYDTDHDGLADGYEVTYQFNPLVSNTPETDTDGDGLTDIDEQIYGTSPRVADSDGDGRRDGIEASQGSNPANAADGGAAPPIDEVVNVEFSIGAGEYDGDSEDAFQAYQMKIFEKLPSGAESLRYTHRSNAASSTANKRSYPVSKKNSYRIEIIPQQPAAADNKDFDYHADIKLPEKSNFIKHDPDSILGSHEQDEEPGTPFPQSGKSAHLLPVEVDVAKIAHNAAAGKLDDSKRESTGAFVPLNSDDDDYSATSTDLGSDKDQTGAITGENDLLPIYLKKLPQLTGAKFLLDIPSKIKVWKNSNRQDAVTGTTEFDASVDTTVYAEGVSNGSDLLKLTLRHGVQDKADIARLKITVFELKGVLNVPGYTAYSYTADGSFPTGSKWGAANGGSVKSGSTATQATILWDQGPVVGKAVYEVSSDYVWDLEVNVVQIKVATGASNKLVYSVDSYQNPQYQQQIKSSTDKAVEASLTIDKVIGPSVSGVTRGEQFLEIGFIQNGRFTRAHALYDGLNPKMRKRSSLEDGVHHIDYFTGTLPSTAPWYDSANVSGSDGFHQVPAGGITSHVFNVSDAPWVSATDTMILLIGTASDMADKFNIEFDFNLYFAVRTVQDVNVSKNVFTQRGKASWKFDGSGSINASGGWTRTGTGNTGSASFSEVTNGDVVPVTTGTPINTLLKSRTFITENQ